MQKRVPTGLASIQTLLSCCFLFISFHFSPVFSFIGIPSGYVFSILYHDLTSFPVFYSFGLLVTLLPIDHSAPFPFLVLVLLGSSAIGHLK
ncbi:unnamed protein product [Citrullus colocynthis]|uniref:Uncharacterized protein n=1 Tax=Citrullus colocynthis TaxID=252529 RepID=A0ABP0Y674_9ROSI